MGRWESDFNCRSAMWILTQNIYIFKEQWNIVLLKATIFNHPINRKHKHNKTEFIMWMIGCKKNWPGQKFSCTIFCATQNDVWCTHDRVFPTGGKGGVPPTSRKFAQYANLFECAMSYKKKLKKKTLWPLFMDGVQLPQG